MIYTINYDTTVVVDDKIVYEFLASRNTQETKLWETERERTRIKIHIQFACKQVFSLSQRSTIPYHCCSQIDF